MDQWRNTSTKEPKIIGIDSLVLPGHLSRKGMSDFIRADNLVTVYECDLQFREQIFIERTIDDPEQVVYKKR